MIEGGKRGGTPEHNRGRISEHTGNGGGPLARLRGALNPYERYLGGFFVDGRGGAFAGSRAFVVLG